MQRIAVSFLSLLLIRFWFWCRQTMSRARELHAEMFPTFMSRPTSAVSTKMFSDSVSSTPMHPNAPIAHHGRPFPISRPSTASGTATPAESLAPMEPALREEPVQYSVVLNPVPDEALQYYARARQSTYKMREHLSFDHAKSGGYQRPGSPLQRGGLYRSGLFGKPITTVLWGPASVPHSVEISPHLKHLRHADADGHAGSRPVSATKRQLSPLTLGGTGGGGAPRPASAAQGRGGGKVEGGSSSPRSPRSPRSPLTLRSPRSPAGSEAASASAPGSMLSSPRAADHPARAPLEATSGSVGGGGGFGGFGGGGGGGGGDGGERLTSSRAIYEALRVPPPRGSRLTPVRLLRASWIIAQAREVRKAKKMGSGPFARKELQRLILKRRQEMPEEAFMSETDVERLHPPGGAAAHRVAVFAASYAWRTEQHPDPEVRCALSLTPNQRSVHVHVHVHVCRLSCGASLVHAPHVVVPAPP